MFFLNLHIVINFTTSEVTNLTGSLCEVNVHCTVVGVVPLRIVPDIVTEESIGLLVYQYIPTDTCMPDTCTLLLSYCLKYKLLMYNNMRQSSDRQAACDSPYLHHQRRNTMKV